MIPRRKVFIILCLFAFCAIPVYTSASLPMVGFPLKPSPAEGPYQDVAFLEKANMSIYALSNTSIPNGTTLLDLKSIQQQISKMNISPELYPLASNINAFLYYTGKAGTEYSDAMSLSSSPFSPIDQNNGLFSDAEMYYSAATSVWNRIKAQYPDVTLYTMHITTDQSSYSSSLMGGEESKYGAKSGLW
ncbi:MAG: hypothetical protein V1862_01390 [Methanobacteriota archaeon]